MKAIYLTGFMGAGKTTVGKRLGEVLQLPVIDTDAYIEQQVGKTIADIFAEEGEGVFRAYEREVLKKLPTEHIVITTGGGIVIQEENRRFMSNHGIVIYLHCELHELFRRLADDATRPLLMENKQSQMKQLFEQRLPWYRQAHITIDTTNRTVDDIVETIVSLLKSSRF
ncbi:shikimate kinase [Anoxybacillus tengchongensis]|uniref:Shikimate kinase n=1 Tax=Anoxybacillus tengchongensis TaxID=576944 RepID=A0A7W9YNL3_9BACL|nr:shikimate kinase [Anoxybacillus tengchongensis]MBB6175320.1 shikimate kinase [Anoxybacillus tengchongensis]